MGGANRHCSVMQAGLECFFNFVLLCFETQAMWLLTNKSASMATKGDAKIALHHLSTHMPRASQRVESSQPRNTHSKGGARPPFDLLKNTKQRGTQSKCKEHPHSKEGTRCSNGSNKPTAQANKPFARNKQKLGLTNSLPSEPSFRLSLHFLSPHASPLLSQPVHGERKASLAVTNGPLWQQQPSYQASCISWHNLSRAL